MISRRLLTCTLLILGHTIAAAPPSFHGPNGSVTLSIDSTKCWVRPDTMLEQQNLAFLVDSFARIDSVRSDAQAPDDFVLVHISDGTGLDKFLDSLQELTVVDRVEPFYVLDGHSFAASDKLLCALKPGHSIQELSVRLDSDHVLVQGTLYGGQSMFILQLTDNTVGRAIDLASRIDTLSEVAYCYPVFATFPEPTTYRIEDYYNSKQTHLNKIIGALNSKSVWDFAGLTRPVVIAVIDDGVDEYHEELTPDRVLNGRDFADGDNNAEPPIDRAHGMACAGIIAAAHSNSYPSPTSSGIAGVNPHARILPIKIYRSVDGKGMPLAELGQAFTYAYKNGAAILHNSWVVTPASAVDLYLEAAIDSAATYGRGGKGCPVIFSSGNSGAGTLRYPSGLENCFSVGASRLNDSVWYFSSYGAGLDAFAPSGDGNFVGDLWSLDQMGSQGYNPIWMTGCGLVGGENNLNYTCKFGGTSGSSPFASGIASLLLSRDSMLTRQEVYSILRGSCQTSFSWGFIIPPTPKYGYGRVDAFRAVLSISHGDVNNDAAIGIEDLLFLIDFLFNDGPVPFPSRLLGDADCVGEVDIGDVSFLIDHLFVTNPPIPTPCFNY